MTHDIGEFKRREGEKTKESILNWFQQNPLGRQRECARALGLNEMTVSKHCKELRERQASSIVTFEPIGDVAGRVVKGLDPND